MKGTIFTAADALICHVSSITVCLHTNKISTFWGRGWRCREGGSTLSPTTLHSIYQGKVKNDTWKEKLLQSQPVWSGELFKDGAGKKSADRNCEVMSSWNRTTFCFSSQLHKVRKAPAERGRWMCVLNWMWEGLADLEWEGGEMVALRQCWKHKSAHSCDTWLRSIQFPNSRRRKSSTSGSSGRRVRRGWAGTWENRSTTTP